MLFGCGVNADIQLHGCLAIRLLATSVHVANPFSLGYLMTLLQLFATYTALRVRDHALFLVKYILRK
jgi:hypothetical protein